MFKFSVLTFAGNCTVSSRDESKIHEYMKDRARVFGERKYEVKTIRIPASWLLMIHHGWKGGTIHQVSQATGLTVSQILSLHEVQPGDSVLDVMSDYHLGYHSGHIIADMSLIRDKEQYWRGVCEHVRQYRVSDVYQMYLSNP